MRSRTNLSKRARRLLSCVSRRNCAAAIRCLPANSPDHGKRTSLAGGSPRSRSRNMSSIAGLASGTGSSQFCWVAAIRVPTHPLNENSDRDSRSRTGSTILDLLRTSVSNETPCTQVCAARLSYSPLNHSKVSEMVPLRPTALVVTLGRKLLASEHLCDFESSAMPSQFLRLSQSILPQRGPGASFDPHDAVKEAGVLSQR